MKLQQSVVPRSSAGRWGPPLPALPEVPSGHQRFEPGAYETPVVGGNREDLYEPPSSMASGTLPHVSSASSLDNFASSQPTDLSGMTTMQSVHLAAFAPDGTPMPPVRPSLAQLPLSTPSPAPGLSPQPLVMPSHSRESSTAGTPSLPPRVFGMLGGPEEQEEAGYVSTREIRF
jgi:hypothetical protein